MPASRISSVHHLLSSLTSVLPTTLTSLTSLPSLLTSTHVSLHFTPRHYLFRNTSLHFTSLRHFYLYLYPVHSSLNSLTPTFNS
jgi:hypothetical protein